MPAKEGWNCLAVKYQNAVILRLVRVWTVGGGCRFYGSFSYAPLIYENPHTLLHACLEIATAKNHASNSFSHWEKVGLRGLKIATDKTFLTRLILRLSKDKSCNYGHRRVLNTAHHTTSYNLHISFGFFGSLTQMLFAFNLTKANRQWRYLHHFVGIDVSNSLFKTKDFWCS